MREEYTGRRGRPQKVPDRKLLEEAFAPNRNITVKELAQKIRVHRNTLSSYLRQYEITPRQYAGISDEDLDVIVQQYREERPQSGIRYLQGRLRKQHSIRCRSA